MVTFITDERIQDRKHYLKVIKEQPTFKIGKLVIVNIQPMAGKIKGKQDNRIMVMGAYTNEYHVFQNKKEIDDTFEELNYETYMAVTNLS